MRKICLNVFYCICVVILYFIYVCNYVKYSLYYCESKEKIKIEINNNV